jgi:two-component system nitrogen regulation response regulator NtrX
MAAGRILVVDDEPGVRAALEGILRDEGFEVATAASGEEGLLAVDAGAFDAILLDIWLPGKDGLETLMAIREKRVDSEVVMISGHGTIETAVRATKLGAFDFIEKPLSLERTLLVLRNALRQRRLERRNRSLLEQLDRDTEILGTSAAAERLRALVAAAAASEAPVFVLGESGSGKETVARRVHATGARAGEAFVVVPCGALDATASEAALFGPGEAGGRLALAGAGTLYLEDVERLVEPVQKRLAAELERGDGRRPDVRVIAGAAPSGASIDGALRSRIEVLRIDVPPLRERREDIALLAERFLRDLSREYGRPAKRFDADSLQVLGSHAWPGNVRELRNVVERLLLVTAGETITAQDLPAELGGRRDPREDLYRDFRSLAEGLESFERYYIRRTVADVRGDVPAAAARLAVEPGALKARMRKLGLE